MRNRSALGANAWPTAGAPAAFALPVAARLPAGWSRPRLAVLWADFEGVRHVTRTVRSHRVGSDAQAIASARERVSSMSSMCACAIVFMTKHLRAREGALQHRGKRRVVVRGHGAATLALIPSYFSTRLRFGTVSSGPTRSKRVMIFSIFSLYINRNVLGVQRLAHPPVRPIGSERIFQRRK